MTVRVAFLRAVNLGKRRVPMARLAEIVEGLGGDGVWTYINSGNVVFEAAGSRGDLERSLESELEKAFGFEVTTFVRTAAELRATIALHPFEVEPDDTYFLTMLKSALTPTQARGLEGLSNDFDTLVVKGRDVHWRMHGKSIDTRLPTSAWEKHVGRQRSTSRNMTMLRKLVAKIDG